jgi:zinc D-Ala-D-Ala carboxypeptidase
MKISEHLELSELTRSDNAKRLGINNMPTPEHIENLKKLAERVFEPIRNNFKVPVFISSGYRSKELNEETAGSSKTSDHAFGRAIDIDMDNSANGVTNNNIFHWAKDNLKFKQIIAEYPIDGKLSWCHISYDENNLKNEILICVKENNKPHYLPYKGNEKLIK